MAADRCAFFVAVWALAASVTALPAQTDREAIEFFERKIRPVLAEKCYLCHGPENDPMGELRVDSKQALLKGGSRGAAIVAGDPDAGLLIRAIRYTDPDLVMPPTGKLSAEEIEDFETWVRMGAPDPRTEQLTSVSPQETIDLAEGRKFWAFRPLARDTLPAARDAIKNADWVTSPIDYFILAKLEENGLTPSPPADKRTLLRRVSFDVIGLPPTPEEINAFLTDRSPKAFETVVERLLASPHYGERWGRHWLDLVRFAETNGHEYDNDKLDAWRYRDYVIRALNDDIPYDRFVKEHIAGDLLAARRVRDDKVHWESQLGTGFYWFGEVLNSPTDSVKSKADTVDNQIDVLSKAFLGLTVACARCHDHKFDPIPTADYYSLAGILHSTAIRDASIDSEERDERIAALRREIGEINGDIRAIAERAPRTALARWNSHLRAAAELLTVDEEEFDCRFDEASALGGLDRAELKAWLVLLRQASEEPDHPLYPLAKLARPAESPKKAGQSPPESHDKPAPSFAERLKRVRQKLAEVTERANPAHPDNKARGDVIYEDFNGSDFSAWTIEGRAFGEAPTTQLPANQPLGSFAGETAANSFGSGSDKLMGSLTTGKFRMPKIYMHVRMAGTPDPKPFPINPDIRVTLDADGHKTQLYTLTQPNVWQWVTRRMTKEIGRVCYIEIVDRSASGHITVDKIVFSESADPPWTAPDERIRTLIADEKIASVEDLIEAYTTLYEQLGVNARPEDRRLRTGLRPPRAVEDYARAALSAEQRQDLTALREKRRAIEADIPESLFGMVSKDENPRDIAIHQRGNHKNLGEEVPRQFLQVIAGEAQQPFRDGSGRLQLAEAMVSPENPLAARVLVNRLWRHHFGSGIVATTDNFGKTGARPTHPQLLDYLAGRVMDKGWSLKEMHRVILLSSSYRMSSRPSERSSEIDPENKWLQHARVKRLEAEAIRDAVLTVSGSLDKTVGGPGIAPYISNYQDGRGKPAGGPLNGAGRRSIYLQVRRNFISPMFLAFDYPPPISTIGRRGASTVPSQALMMMNNEFIGREAEAWAKRLTAQPNSRRQRIEAMFQTAFSRPPDAEEVRDAEAFLDGQKAEYKTFGDDDPRIWADLAHVLFNSTEFIFVR